MARASKWGMPIPASGEVHWGMKGKVGNMKSFRRGGYRRRSRMGGNWVSYVDDGPGVLSSQGAARTPVILAGMSAQDSVTGGFQSTVATGYLGAYQRRTITRFQGAIWVWLDPDDDVTTDDYHNLMMVNYVWRKCQFNANAAGGLNPFTAGDLDPSIGGGDIGRLLRFRDINKWGTVHVWGGIGSYSETQGAYSGVTTGAAVLNGTVSADFNYNKNRFNGPHLARIPFPRGPIALKEGEGIQCIASAWSPRQFSGSFTGGGRGVLYARQYRALHC